MIQDVRLAESEFKKRFLAEVEQKDAMLGVIRALEALSVSQGWREFKEKVGAYREAALKALIYEQDSGQKFRISGKVEALNTLVSAIDSSASEAERIAAEKSDLVNRFKGQVVGESFRLNPAGGKWNV